MLTLDINKARPLTFEIQLNGIDAAELKGSLKFKIDNVEYGFPAEFKSESIIVNILPLNSIIKHELKEGTILKAILEANGNGFYLCPWEGEFEVSNPVKLEVKIKEDEITETYKPNVQVQIVKDNIEEAISDIIESEPIEVETIKEDKLIEDDPIDSLSEDISQVETHIVKPKFNLDNITKEQIFQFMTYMGTKKPAIQDIIFEQSQIQAQSDKPKDIFKQVYKVLKKKSIKP